MDPPILPAPISAIFFLAINSSNQFDQNVF
jgi:hypothetical protein